MVADKRSSIRVPLSVSVTYRVNDQERADAYRVESVNIGEGGIFLKADLPLGIGTEVELEFSLPGNSAILRFRGKVAWAGGSGGGVEGSGRGKGIEFTECDDRCRSELRQYVEKAL
jgi:uncharacterized protein (TIGR02266 family)